MTAPVRLVERGAFARALAGDLRAALADAGQTHVDGGTEVDPMAPAVLVVADEGDPLLDDVPARWHEAGRPSLVVVHTHPDVRVGPLDVPGTALCRACFATRRRQHDLAGAPPAHWPGGGLAVGVDGFPAYLTSLVAALVVDRLAAVTDADHATAEVAVVNTESLACRVHPVVAVNRCAQCADQRPVGRKHGRAPMFPDLAEVSR